nr:unnamed protein product [Bacillus sp.] [Bacillus sp. (in: firmicutes)]
MPVDEDCIGSSCRCCIRMVISTFPNDVSAAVLFNKFIFKIFLGRNTYIIVPGWVLIHHLIKHRPNRLIRVPISKLIHISNNIQIGTKASGRIINSKTDTNLVTG